MVYLTRRYRFCASHRLHNEALTEEENLRIYGKCDSPFRPRAQLCAGSDGGRADRPGNRHGV